MQAKYIYVLGSKPLTKVAVMTLTATSHAALDHLTYSISRHKMSTSIDGREYFVLAVWIG